MRMLMTMVTLNACDRSLSSTSRLTMGPLFRPRVSLPCALLGDAPGAGSTFRSANVPTGRTKRPFVRPVGTSADRFVDPAPPAPGRVRPVETLANAKVDLAPSKSEHSAIWSNFLAKIPFVRALAGDAGFRLRGATLLFSAIHLKETEKELWATIKACVEEIDKERPYGRIYLSDVQGA